MKILTKRNGIIAGVASLAVATVLLFPHTYTVSRSYSLLADGSADFTSISDCIEKAGMNDTCKLYGDFPETVVVSKAGLSLVGAAATVQCVNITANNVTVSNTNIVGCSTFGVTISGDGAVVENNTISKSLKDGILIQQSANGADVRKNVISEAGQSCIEVRGTNNVINGNDCSKTVQHKTGQSQSSTDDADCFRYFGSGHVFKNNYCHDITFGVQPTGTNTDPHIDGFQTWSDTGRGIAHDIVFDGNIIIGFGRGNDAANKGIQLSGGTFNLTFRNNVFNTTLGMLCSDSVSGIVIDHNTFVGDKNDTGSWGINANRCNNPKITNNIFAYHPNGAGHIQGSPYTASNNCIWQSGNPVSNPGDIRANPLFVNEAAQDYHLLPGSPCAGKGVVFAGSVTPTPANTFTATNTKTVTPSPTFTLVPSLTAIPSIAPSRTPSTTPVFTSTQPSTASFTPIPSLTPSRTPSPTATSTAIVIPTMICLEDGVIKICYELK